MTARTGQADVVGTFIAVVRADRTVRLEDFGRTDGGAAGARLGDIAIAGIGAADCCHGLEVRQASTGPVAGIGIVADGERRITAGTSRRQEGIRTGAVHGTDVGRTFVAVVTVRGSRTVCASADRCTRTNACETRVRIRARVAVVAGINVVEMGTSAAEQAQVVRARIGVVTFTGCDALYTNQVPFVAVRKIDARVRLIATNADLASFVTVAEDAVRTGQAVHHRTAETAGNGIAEIRCADIAVVAIWRRTAHTRTGRACIVRRTGVAIVAWVCIIRVRAGSVDETHVVCANVGVIAVGRGRTVDALDNRCPGAGSARADIKFRTRLIVIARIAVVEKGA